MVKSDKKQHVEEKKKEDPTILTSNNLEKIASLYNRTSNIILGSREQELKRQEERQKYLKEVLAKEGVL
jgi:hypothetical protein